MAKDKRQAIQIDITKNTGNSHGRNQKHDRQVIHMNITKHKAIHMGITKNTGRYEGR